MPSYLWIWTRNASIENQCVDTLAPRVKGVNELGDWDWRIHTPACGIRASESLQYNPGAQLGARGDLGRMAWSSVGVRSKREVYAHTWMIPFTVQQKLTHHHKTIILQFKKRIKMRGLEFGRLYMIWHYIKVSKELKYWGNRIWCTVNPHFNEKKRENQGNE